MTKTQIKRDREHKIERVNTLKRLLTLRALPGIKRKRRQVLDNTIADLIRHRRLHGSDQVVDHYARLAELAASA